MKPLHEIAPWKVVTVGFGLGIFFMLAALAFGLVIDARLHAGTLGPLGLLIMAAGFGLAIATPALSSSAMHWLIEKRRRRGLPE